MSELISNRDNRATIRWKLLTSASALALSVTASSLTAAKAEDADRPPIWIELGGQAENITGQGQAFAPAFLSAYSNSSVLSGGTSPTQAQKPPLFNFGEEAKISYQPESLDWVFSAALRYGRTGSSQEVDHQTNGAFKIKYNSGVPNPTQNIRGIDNFSDTHARHSDSYTILDFSVGKDVGLGMFGKDSSSTVSLGVRIAQFTSKAAFDIRARPDLQFKYYHFGSYPGYYGTLKFPYFHTYHATGQAARSFRGVGPSLSWSGSTPFVGNSQDGEITLDWGANAALLFGKQKARARHQESGHYVTWQFVFQNSPYKLAYHHPQTGHDTDRSVTVPNLGGFAGLSYRYQDAKISLGYRADVFFGAMDTSIDVAKKSNLTFNGPYASVSIGLGD